jgi:chromosome segregation ATPase
VATPDPELRAYEELIGSLEDKVGGLSAVHQGLGEAAQSLVGAHRELDEAKRSIDRLTASSQGILDEVRRLRPAELGAALDASLVRLSRETAEGQAAVGERLLTLAGEEATAREEANARFAMLAQRLAAHEESVAARLLAAQEVVADSHQATQGALVVLRDRQEILRQTLADVQRQQGDLAQRLDALLPLLTDLQRHQTILAQQLASVADATVGIRDAADATQSTVITILQVSERFGPTLSSAWGQARHDLVAENARTRRQQLVSSLVILTAIVLAWAALEGLIPNP